MFATLSAFISAFSTSRTIILLILTLLSNLLRSRDVCLLFYLQNVLYRCRPASRCGAATASCWCWRCSAWSWCCSRWVGRGVVE